MKAEKINELIESYINGNISYVMQVVKKQTKATRKQIYIDAMYLGSNAQTFFFNLI